MALPGNQAARCVFAKHDGGRNTIVRRTMLDGTEGEIGIHIQKHVHPDRKTPDRLEKMMFTTENSMLARCCTHVTVVIAPINSTDALAYDG